MATSDASQRRLEACINPSDQSAILRPQLEHRSYLARSIWSISKGQKVLEIGCGQGECTVALADVFLELKDNEGHVDAIDPCDPNYGSPFTVGESQQHLKNGPYGRFITFHRADPFDFLEANQKMFDIVVLNNCLWYFDSEERISQLLDMLVTGKHAKRIAIAEWSLEAPSTAQVPHLLAALTRANLEHLNSKSTENIRTPISLAWMQRWLEQRNLKHTVKMVEGHEGLLDGQWEVGSILRDRFEEKRAAVPMNAAQRFAIDIMRDSVVTAVAKLPNGLQDVRCMPIWNVIVDLTT